MARKDRNVPRSLLQLPTGQTTTGNPFANKTISGAQNRGCHWRECFPCASQHENWEAGPSPYWPNLLNSLARPERFERPTLRFVVWGTHLKSLGSVPVKTAYLDSPSGTAPCIETAALPYRFLKRSMRSRIMSDPTDDQSRSDAWRVTSLRNT